ncbi:MAG: DUF3426 domain-containing protein [Candidatus Sedimenticola sp. 6PFRAG7]
MYTQCPHCQTVFRISAEQLRAASGKAHCCHCDRVFSALENLKEDDKASSPSIETAPPSAEEALPPVRRRDVTDSLTQLLTELQTESFATGDDQEQPTPHDAPPSQGKKNLFSDYLAELGDETEEGKPQADTSDAEDLRLDAFSIHDQPDADRIQELSIPSMDEEVGIAYETLEQDTHQLSFQILDDPTETLERDEELELPWATEWDEEIAPERPVNTPEPADEDEPDSDQVNFTREEMASLTPEGAVDDGFSGPYSTLDGDTEQIDAAYLGADTETAEDSGYDEPDTIPSHFVLEETEMASSDELPYDGIDEDTEPTPDQAEDEPEAVYDEPDTELSHFTLEETEMASSEEGFAEPGEPAETDTPETTLPFKVPDDLPDIEPSEHQPLDLVEIELPEEERGAGSLKWIMLILLLLGLALLQLTWFGRDHLARYPGMLDTMTSFCAIAKCELQPRKAPEQFKITNRMMVSHPERENALVLLLAFTNQAEHPQPYPRLQLSLHDNNETLTARRIFSPNEYMGRKVGASELIETGSTVSVEMPMEDPGNRVTGFQFDFF